MTAPRIAVLMATTGLVLAACGPGSDSAPPVTEPAPAADAPIADPTEAADGLSEAETAPESDAPAVSDDGATDTAEPEAVSDPPPTEPADSPQDAPVEEPPATEAPVEAPAEPVLGGRSLAPDLQPAAQFDANPFPDLVVDDLGNGGQANIANILPSDRPVLLWAWAPH